jgi:hypothetical protein
MSAAPSIASQNPKNLLSVCFIFQQTKDLRFCHDILLLLYLFPQMVTQSMRSLSSCFISDKYAPVDFIWLLQAGLSVQFEPRHQVQTYVPQEAGSLDLSCENIDSISLW